MQSHPHTALERKSKPKSAESTLFAVQLWLEEVITDYRLKVSTGESTLHDAGAWGRGLAVSPTCSSSLAIVCSSPDGPKAGGVNWRGVSHRQHGSTKAFHRDLVIMGGSAGESLDL